LSMRNHIVGKSYISLRLCENRDFKRTACATRRGRENKKRGESRCELKALFQKFQERGDKNTSSPAMWKPRKALPCKGEMCTMHKTKGDQGRGGEIMGASRSTLI